MATTTTTTPFVMRLIGALALDGWDTHFNEGAVGGRLSALLGALDGALAAVESSMGAAWNETVVTVVTEFGRTAQENGNSGTDHGHGDVMMVLGGPVAGGKVYGHWPGLAQEQLYEGRDLAVTTDFRTVLGELVRGHLGQHEIGQVFPNFQMGGPLGLLRA